MAGGLYNKKKAGQYITTFGSMGGHGGVLSNCFSVFAWYTA